MNVIEKAQQRMMEEDRAGNDDAVIYWAAYIDGANAQLREDKSKLEDSYWDACLDGRVRMVEER